MLTYKGVIVKINGNYNFSFTVLPENGIFVFGSNTQGKHGKGAAKIAKEWFGAKYGKSKGLQGRSYAIITKDLTKSTHPSVSKEYIIEQIKELYDFALNNQNSLFYVAYNGDNKSINLNGYSINDMVDMFNCCDVPNNIVFEEKFYELLKVKIDDKG